MHDQKIVYWRPYENPDGTVNFYQVKQSALPLNSTQQGKYRKEYYEFALNYNRTFSDKHNVFVNVYGGGPTGQAEAIRHGIARTLILINPEFRTILKRASLLRRDPRIVERKKYGQPGARKRFQFSKR